MKRVKWNRWTPVSLCAAMCLLSGRLMAQQPPAVSKSASLKPVHAGGITIQLPEGWSWAKEDGEVSSFHDDARNAPPTRGFLGVASIGFNPYPQTNFSGALVYLSAQRSKDAQACTREATEPQPLERNAMARFPEPAPPAAAPKLAGVEFNHGHDAHGVVCTEARDEIYTTMHEGSCYRLDLVLHTFCGGQAMGARDMTMQEIDEIRARMNAIFATFKFDR